jgi:hypothetical protein
MDKIPSTVFRMANEPVWNELDKLKADKAAVIPLLARAESFIAGFEDDETQAGVPALLRDLRAAVAGESAPTVNAMMLAALRRVQVVCEDAVFDAQQAGEAENEAGAQEAWDMVNTAIAAAEAQGGPASDALDALTRIVGERIFGDGTDASEQRVIDLCIEAQKAHGITRESWAGVLSGGPSETPPFRAFVEKVARFTTLGDEYTEDTPEGADLRAKYEDVDEYRSDLSDERLCGEFAAFEEIIRDARSIIAKAEGR